MPSWCKGALASAYLRTERRWAARWPFRRGRGIFYRFRPFLYRLKIFPVRLELEEGVSLQLDPEDILQNVLLLEKEWEPQVWCGIAKHLRAGAVFIDVGAHIGFYALKAARIVGRSGRVLAIEANPNTVRLLEANVAASAANVTVQSCACCGSEGNVTLHAGPATHTSHASLARQNVDKVSQTEESLTFAVEGRRLDRVVEELNLHRVDVIKIDVEGAELLALQGAARTLSRFQPVVILEIVAENLAAMNARVEEIHALLWDAGYDRGNQLGETDWEFLPRLRQPSP